MHGGHHVEQVDFERGAKLSRGQLCGGRLDDHAGIVDQHVQPLLTPPKVGRHGANAVGVADVELHPGG